MLFFRRFGQHPYVSFATMVDPVGRFWIICGCSVCGPAAEWRKQCSDPKRVTHWVGLYALEHGHGLQPVRPR